MFDNFNLPAGCSTDDFDFEEDPDEPYFEYEMIDLVYDKSEGGG